MMAAALEWVLPSALVLISFAVLVGLAWRNTQRQIARTLERRSNPTHEEYLALMLPEVSCEASEFLWETASCYLKPKLAPHPDDDLMKDLPIDPDDVSLDWPREFAHQQGFAVRELADWPPGWPVTLRNFGKWLDMRDGNYPTQRQSPADQPPA